MATTNGTTAASLPPAGSSAPTTPRKHPPKRLIVCCDGTWNAPDIDGKSLTNVARITRCISDVDEWKEKDPAKPERPTYSQIVHYQPGVGVGTGSFSNVWDGMTGRGELYLTRSWDGGLSLDRTFKIHSRSVQLHLSQLVTGCRSDCSNRLLTWGVHSSLRS
jgi:hypothetical protein